MDVQMSAGVQMRAVTISREYGSGGGEIARRLATRLGWRLDCPSSGYQTGLALS